MTDDITTDVAIVGGGIAGIACAVALVDGGVKVRVFEAGKRLGGRAQSWIDRTTGDVVDIGPHIFLNVYRNALKLFDLLGTSERIVWQTEPLIRLREGRRVTDMFVHRLPPPLHLAPSFAKVSSVSFRDKLSNISIAKLAMRMDEQTVRELDTIPARELLRREGVTESFVRWFWETACLTVMNVPLDQCSAGALMRVFAQLIGRRDYCIGFAACGLGELFVPQSTRRVSASGGSIHLNTPVARVYARDQTAESLELEDGTCVRAPFYVLALTPHKLRSVLPEALRIEPPFAYLSDFVPSPYISVYSWFDRKLSREKFWTQIYDSSRLNSDFYDLSNIRADWRERPSVIASNIIFSHRAHALTDEQIVARTTKEIKESLPSTNRARLVHARVHRISMAIPCPSPGIEAKRPASLGPIQNMLLAGDWTETHLPSCMESAVASGWTAAEHVLRALGRESHWVERVKEREGFARIAHANHQRYMDERRRSSVGSTADSLAGAEPVLGVA